MLEALVGLATPTQQNEARYLRVDNTTVINENTLAIGAFYFGTVALGLMSVLNDAANAVAKHRALKFKAKKATVNPNEEFVVSPKEYEEEYLVDDYEKYESELREYQKQYQKYLDEYAEWAEMYGQDPTPPNKR